MRSNQLRRDHKSEKIKPDELWNKLWLFWVNKLHEKQMDDLHDVKSLHP